MLDLNILLFDNFETLDALGPAEVIGRLPEEYNIKCYSLNGGIVTSKQNIKIETLPIADIVGNYILLIPGGQGTRQLVDDSLFIEQLKQLAKKAKYVLTVCTGSALLAKTGLLDNKDATSNKLAFNWVVSTNEKVNWIKKARWVIAENIYSSSGVSAGIDMTLGFLADQHGMTLAEKIAHDIEYIWHKDKKEDFFAL